MGFLSIDTGTIIFTLLNTLILFLGLKHFLFKPVQKILTERQSAVDQTLQDAEDARTRAEAAETEYNEKLAAAKEESAELVRKATRKAQQRSVMVAEKVVGREINPDDHARLIDEFIDSVGDTE